jgi:transposase-like protein
MTYNDDFTLPTEYLEQLAEQGMEYMPELIRILLNLAMRAERKGYANGFKEKTLKTRLGEIHFDIPQVRNGSF